MTAETIAACAERILVGSPYPTSFTHHGGIGCFHIRTPQPPRQIAWNLRDRIADELMIESARAGGTLLSYRGTSADRLDVAARSGIDVDEGSVFWASDDFAKALEYGGDYPLVLVLDAARIEASWGQVLGDAPDHDAKLKAARERFGQEGYYDAGSGHWLFSFLPQSDNRRLTGYEFAYGHRCKDPAQPPTLLMLQFEPA